MHKLKTLCLSLVVGFSTTAANAQNAENSTLIDVTYDSPGCYLADEWCIPTYKHHVVDYPADEIVLAYDSKISDEKAESLLEQYKLRSKKADDIGSIGMKVITADTGGKDPFFLMQKINSAQDEIDANTNTYFFTPATQGNPKKAAKSTIPKGGYPLSLTEVTSAYPFTKGRGVNVCVVDTPIDINHHSLNSSKIKRAELVPAGNAKNLQHGTEVTGIIVSQNPRIGIAPDVNLFAVSAFSTDPRNPKQRTSTASLIVKALDICIKQRADVINLSFAGGKDKLVEKLIKKALQKGITVVSSAGNGGPSAKPAYPAAYSGVIAVTAVDKSKVLFKQANRGKYIDIAAPGVGIFTTAPNGSYHISSGTSLATAHVTGLIALLKSLNRRADIPNVLKKATNDLGRRGFDAEFGHGLVSMNKALTMVK